MTSVSDLLSALEKASVLARRNTPPYVRRCEVGGILPEAIALDIDAKDYQVRPDESESLFADYYSACTTHARCREMRIRLWLENKSSSVMRVVGIQPNKRVVDYSFQSAVAFPPQGAISGEAERFECLLDRDAPTMKKFSLRGTERIYTSTDYYFDEGVLEFSPGHMLCLSIIFVADQRTYQIEPELILEINGNTRALPFPLEQECIICPISVIPEEMMYVRTFSRTPPFISPNPELFKRCCS